MSSPVAPPAVWVRGAASTAAGLAAALNLVLAPRVVASVPKVQNVVGALWLFGTHGALGLALCCLLVPLARGVPITRRGAAWGLCLALLSLLAIPVSYAATKLFEYGPFDRLF